MRTDISALVASEAVVILPGWQESHGPSLEVWIAVDLDTPVYWSETADGTIRLHQMHGFNHVRLPLCG